MNPEEQNKIRDAADAVKGVVQAIPVYQDIVQPAAKEIGIALQNVTKTIHIALAPISAMVWGYDKIKEFIATKLAQKLQNVPEKDIITPNPIVAGPALEALRYAGNEESLREMYANLLATSLDSKTSTDAHPSFVDIIKSLLPDEARIIRLFAVQSSYPLIDIRAELKDKTGYEPFFSNFSLLAIEAGCSFPKQTPNYINNLCRLGLLGIPEGTIITGDADYQPLESDPTVKQMQDEIEKDTKLKMGIERKLIHVTDFGRQFIRACVIEKNAK